LGNINRDLSFSSAVPLDIIDEANLRSLPPRERLYRCASIIENEVDESMRWDAVYLAGEIAKTNPADPIFDKVADLVSWILENDDNGIIKHESCFQIAARDTRKNS
jgi:hypothetical protein